jgi:hypothetical protein
MQGKRPSLVELIFIIHLYLSGGLLGVLLRTDVKMTFVSKNVFTTC